MNKFFRVTLLAILFSVCVPLVSHAEVTITQTLRNSSRGQEVVMLQQFLREKNFFTHPTNTGYFGLVTKAAVVSFQNAFGLGADGIVGPATRKKIAELTATKPAAETVAPIQYTSVINTSSRDTSAPRVTITEPATNAVAAGNPILIIARAFDNKAVTGVQFQVDGVDIGSQDTSAPYTVDWDSTSVADGPHIVTAVARDAAGNTTTSDPIEVATLNHFLLTVNKGGNGNGTVISAPSGINCGSTCSGDFLYGTTITLTPAAAPGSNFAGWSGACTGTGVCVVSMYDAESVTATFTLNTYVLSIVKAGGGPGTVTSSPAGIDCGATCSAPYNSGTVVSLTATAAMNSIFAGWSGGGCSGTGACVVTTTSAQTVTATFDPI